MRIAPTKTLLFNQMSATTISRVNELVSICREQRLHPTETTAWVKTQVKTDWTGEQVSQLIMEAQRQLAASGSYL